MSQNFRLKFDEFKNSGSAKEDEMPQSDYYASNSHVRNLCFKWPDGRMKFLNYAYLVSGEYLPDEGKIALIFTSVSVIITGSDLAGLFEDLISHRPQLISYTDSRYNELNTSGTFVITDISVLQTE